jgi:glutathione synthase/RimK-type ligase-like ATP-grasp enzyme
MTTTKQARILVVFARNTGQKSTRFGGFVRRIVENGGFSYAQADVVALEDLIFHIKSDGTARVYDPESGVDLSKYDFVYFKSWQLMPELAAAAAHYLEALGIPYADKQVRHEYIAKTTNYMTMWAHNVSVPMTIWASPARLERVVKRQKLDYPIIIKAVHGQKGKDNFLAKDKDEALSILKNTDVDMLIQQFIPNDGDYRIGVYGHRSRWAIYRKSGGKSHLNNTSAGGTAIHLAIKDIDPAILDIAERAAEACDLAVSGVDVVQDKKTKKLYIFEANQGSQIVTGAFTQSNMKAFDRGMKAMVAGRRIIKNRRPLQVIGRTVDVEVMGNGKPFSIRAKVDTGAYQSSLHVEHVELKKRLGSEYLSYSVKDPATGKVHRYKTKEFWRALIKNSFGVEQQRFVVAMHLTINGVQYDTRVSLADRSTQKYPLLIGRKLLQGNFIVNVDLGV